jgi:phage gp36-like protein
MGYLTQDDVLLRFKEQELIQLTDHQGTGSADIELLDRALADANAEIEGYIGARYPLPLDAPIKVLVAYGFDIVRYRLYDDQATDQVTKRYNDAVKFLSLVAAGKIDLGAGPDNLNAGSPAIAAPERVFSGQSLRDY